jgi:hypothetical protein
MPINEEYAEFFFNSQSSVQEYETLVIAHPAFSKTYYIVRNAPNGVTLTLEDTTSHLFTYYPLSIKRTGANDNLDQTLQINLGELSQIIPPEIDRVRAAGQILTKPTLTYRTFRSDTLEIMEGPFVFELPTLARTADQNALQARAPRLNQNATGEIYTMTRFPMLRAFL